ncbi:MAG TPA: histone deacetylase, partial [Desulfomonilia bacterium]|nr:histone deacetylase [Desulfomonilia bacterium]
MIGIVSDPLFMNHDTGGYHPEAPMRIHYIHTLFSRKDPEIAIIDPTPASIEDLMLNHERSYIDSVRHTCASKGYVDLDPDTVCSEDSYETALYAAGSVINLVEMALTGEIDGAFASIRPPGHHAVSNEAMGFCLFNNVAIAARKAIKTFGVKKVMIIDFDVHHGNGTQDSFYGSKDVLYFSSHQSPFYPGSGRLHETGAKGAEGYTINCPLRGGKGDGEMVALYRRIMVPVVHTFQPGLILVSAGFDAHAMDPIGGMEISSKGFGALAALIRDAADKVNAPVVYALEGGYNFDALRDSVKA